VAAAVSLLGDAGTVRVRLEGDRVAVMLDDGTRREWRDLIAIVVEKGKKKLVAVGDTEEELRRGSSTAEQRMLDGVRFVRALAPQGFDHEVAHAYLAYVVHVSRRKSSWWRLNRKPRLELEFPGYSAVPMAKQLAFEDGVRFWGHPALVNGVPARPLSPWIERASWASTLLMALGAIGYAVAGRAPDLRNVGLVGFAAALGLAGLVAWWGEHLKKVLLREAGSDR